MRPEPEQRGVPSHMYELFDAGRRVARLEWRLVPRAAVGWYLVKPSEPPRRLVVDSSIDELGRDQHSATHEWALSAELYAILSTPLALDAAGRELNSQPRERRGRFRRVQAARSFELYVDGVDPLILAHAVPELPLESVSDISVLSGALMPEAFEVIHRRIVLLGGRVVAFRHEDESPG